MKLYYRVVCIKIELIFLQLNDLFVTSRRKSFNICLKIFIRCLTLIEITDFLMTIDKI